MSLGLDAEPAQPLPAELAEVICTAAEKDFLVQHGDEGIPWDRLFFSAKESAFKCVFPLQRRFVEFGQVRIAWLGANAFRVCMEGLPEAEERICGCFAVRDGFILTTAMWRA